MFTQSKTNLPLPLIAGAALIALTGAAHAGVPSPMPQGTHSTSRLVQGAPGFLSNSGDRDTSDLMGPARIELARTFRDSTITADSSASYGSLFNNLTFEGPLSSTGGERLAQGFSEAGFQDNTVVLAAPGFSIGDTVSISATFALDIGFIMEYTEPRTGNGFGFQSFAYDFVLEIAGQNFAFEGEFRDSGSGQTTNSGAPTPGIVTVDLDVPVGEAFGLGARLDSAYYASAVNAEFAAFFSTLSDVAHFRFLGFGDLPEGAEVTSEFGDYVSIPVPSPASSVLAVLGLTLAGTRRRR